MIFLVHYSVDRSKGKPGRLRDLMSDSWHWEKVEAVDEPDAMEKIYEKEGFENVNYFMSVTISS